jgi:hypothetical protein
MEGRREGRKDGRDGREEGMSIHFEQDDKELKRSMMTSM